jgi:hypothetical protein
VSPVWHLLATCTDHRTPDRPPRLQHPFDGTAPRDTVGIVELLQARVLVHPTDFDRAAQRCSTFGLHSIRRYGPLDEPFGIVFAAGGVSLEISRQPGSPPEGVTLWLQVPDVVAAVENLFIEQYDGAVGTPILQPWGLWECRVELFEGVDVLLVEVPRTHPLHWRG